MKDTDRFLIAIVTGILVLIITAFIITAVRQQPSYRTESTPEDVVHNYLLALEQRDYERAYSYLSPGLEGYPEDLEMFIQDVQRNRWNFGYERDHSLVVESGRQSGTNYLVNVRETIFFRDLFPRDPSSSVFTLRLAETRQGWQLIGGDQYFWNCWANLQSYCR